MQGVLLHYDNWENRHKKYEKFKISLKKYGKLKNVKNCNDVTCN